MVARTYGYNYEAASWGTLVESVTEVESITEVLSLLRRCRVCYGGVYWDALKTCLENGFDGYQNIEEVGPNLQCRARFGHEALVELLYHGRIRVSPDLFAAPCG
eukprot:1179695-Prorocentrum_minimum.AAC.2